MTNVRRRWIVERNYSHVIIVFQVLWKFAGAMIVDEHTHLKAALATGHLALCLIFSFHNSKIYCLWLFTTTGSLESGEKIYNLFVECKSIHAYNISRSLL